MKYIKIFILAYLFLQLPYSCSNSNDTQQIILADSNKIEGTWYIVHDATIHIRKYYMSVMNIKEFMGDSLGRQFQSIISDALDQKKFSRNH